LDGAAWDSNWIIEKSYGYCATHLSSILITYIDGPEIDCVWSPSGIITIPDYKRGIEEIGGGAIANRGNLRLINVSISHSSAKNGGGGAIKNKLGSVYMEGGFICDNDASKGGAIYNIRGKLEMHRVGICRNVAFDKGSALYSASSEYYEEYGDGKLILVNVTMGENTAPNNGGVIFAKTDATLKNVTIHRNSTVGIVVKKNQVSMQNTMLSENGDKDCDGVIKTLGNNMESGDTCSLNPTVDFTLVQSPGLASLTDFAGLGGWYPLLPDSPAIDTGNTASCPPVDQEGQSRPNGSGCDIGADEFYEIKKGDDSVLIK
jgi:predicted outer membrane repeat protein